jgi:glyoxylate carboligase
LSTNIAMGGKGIDGIVEFELLATTAVHTPTAVSQLLP